MGEFVRDRLPEAAAFFEAQGVPLTGRGKWRTGRCEFHGGSDSMRVNVASGAWRCMACGEKGGDVLAYLMRRDVVGFVDGARALGAYVDDGQPHRGKTEPATLPPRDAMELAARALGVAHIVISDVRRGVIPSDLSWQQFLTSFEQVSRLAEEYRA